MRNNNEISILVRDWNRIKRKLSTLAKKDINYKLVYFTFIGIGVTAFSTIFPVESSGSLSNWDFAYLTGAGCFILGAFVFFILDQRHSHNRIIDLQEVLDDMAEIDNDVIIKLDNNTTTEQLIFEDNCENLTGWTNYLQGKIDMSNESLTGDFSIKKVGPGDPNGAYKIVGSKFRVGFVISGVIKSPAERVGGAADRIAIEDQTFSGYGFAVNATAKTVVLESRTNGKASALTGTQKQFNIAENRWYKFKFVLNTNWFVELELYDYMNKLICRTEGTFESNIISFDRIALHGGSEYYLDELRIEKNKTLPNIK